LIRENKSKIGRRKTKKIRTNNKCFKRQGIPSFQRQIEVNLVNENSDASSEESATGNIYLNITGEKNQE